MRNNPQACKTGQPRSEKGGNKRQRSKCNDMGGQFKKENRIRKREKTYLALLIQVQEKSQLQLGGTATHFLWPWLYWI